MVLSSDVIHVEYAGSRNEKRRNGRMVYPNERHAVRNTLRKRGVISKSVKPRRPRATIRERERMAQVNSAFDRLRRVVPRGHMTEYQRLSKIATLRLAIQYIRAMNRILGKSTQADNGTQKSIDLLPMRWETERAKIIHDDTDAPRLKKTIRFPRTIPEAHVEEATEQPAWMDGDYAENKTFVLFGCSDELGWDTMDSGEMVDDDDDDDDRSSTTESIVIPTTSSVMTTIPPEQPFTTTLAGMHNTWQTTCAPHHSYWIDDWSVGTRRWGHSGDANHSVEYNTLAGCWYRATDCDGKEEYTWDCGNSDGREEQQQSWLDHENANRMTSGIPTLNNSVCACPPGYPTIDFSPDWNDINH